MRQARLTLFLIVVATSVVCADTWQRANLYFVEWETTVRAALTPQRVRELADYRAVFHRDVVTFANSLRLDALRPNKNKRPRDARLVIDLFTDTGARVTYYSDGADLLTEDNAYSRPVGEAFRKRMTDVAHHHQ